jgi:hypothetical protein
VPMRFMTDPHQMRAMADRFDVHAQAAKTAAVHVLSHEENRR